VALVETALGVHRAFEIAAAAGIARIAFGSVDFALDTGATQDYLPLLYARSTLVTASRAGGLPTPIDGVEVALDDPDAARASALTARALGFGGKLCIHPRQVGPVNEAFTPSVVEVEQARRLIASVRDGAANRVDGQMVDLPVLERARRLLRQAELWSTTPKGTP
jgi:citrate lyase subunit beta/citryl-CoA lyase